MSAFRDEVRVIRPVAWVIAALCWLGMVCFLAGFVLQQKPEPYNWPLFFKVLFAGLAPLPVIFFVLLIGYVYGDAKRRGMRYVLWTWLAALIPNAIGILLYFILRDPLLLTCKSCGLPVRQTFAFCPHCGTSIAPACPACRRAVEAGWSNCPHCGAKLPAS